MNVVTIVMNEFLAICVCISDALEVNTPLHNHRKWPSTAE